MTGDLLWTLAGGAVAIAAIVVFLAVAGRVRRPVVKDTAGRWRAAPRYGRRP